MLGFAHDGIILQPSRRTNPTSKEVNIHILVVVDEVPTAPLAPVEVVPTVVKLPQRYPVTNTMIPRKRRENQTRFDNVFVVADDDAVPVEGVVEPDSSDEKRGK